MHIAICDDNVADRKQLERLLSREAEARIKSGDEPLYIDSYGNIASLMHAPKLYDVFFIDMTCNPEEDGLYVAKLLRTDLVMAPIVLCSSKIDYQAQRSSLSNLFYLQKALKSAEITDTISQVLALKNQEEPTFEIRGRKNTVYIHGDDFLYAQQLNDRQAAVYLTSGDVCDLPDSLLNLDVIMEKHPSLMMIRKRYLINLSHVKKVSLTSILFHNGVKIPLSLSEYLVLKYFSN